MEGSQISICLFLFGCVLVGWGEAQNSGIYGPFLT